MDQTIGDRLKIARKRANIYQADASAAMEMARPSLSAIESNKRAVSAEEVKQFAELYNIPEMELLYGFDNQLEDEKFSSQKQRILTYVAEYAKLKAEDQIEILNLIKHYQKKK